MKDLLPRSYRGLLAWTGGLLFLISLGLFFLAQDLFLAWKGWILLGWMFYLCHLLGVWWIVNRLHHPIKQVERQLSHLQEKEYEKDYVQQVVPIYNQLGKNLSVLGREIATLETERSQQAGQIDLLFRHLSVGVLALDAKGRVSLASQSMQAYFPVDTIVGEPFLQLNKTAELNRLVQEVYDRKVTLHQEMDLYFPEERTVDVRVSPVLQEQNLTQVLLLFYDVTHLRRLEQMRQDFVSNVSHELNTPVTSIKGFAETLLAGAKDDEAVRDQFLGIIHQESQRLQELIRDLLHLSRLEQAPPVLEDQEFSLSNLVSELVEGLSGQVSEKGLTVTAVNQLSSPYRGDRKKVSQVLLNLLTNAIRYTDSGGQIRVSLWQEEEAIRIEVSDTGIGIPEEELERIFERFYRVNKGRSRQTGGTGLGLSIVQSLLASMGGRIDVASQVGKGSQFTVFLPNKKK